MHRAQWSEVIQRDRDAQFLKGLPARRFQNRFAWLDMTRGRTRPVPVHEPGAIAQLKQHLLSVNRGASKHDVSSRHYEERMPHK